MICEQCDFISDDPNVMDGHVRNIHGWRTRCGCVNGSRCAAHTVPVRCDVALPGLGRCVDTSGLVHGHHFKPGQFDAALMLTAEEARDLVDYMAQQYINPNKRPVLSQMLTRIEAHVRVTA